VNQRHRIISVAISLVLYWCAWRSLPGVIDSYPFLTRYAWQYRLLLAIAAALALIGAIGDARVSRTTLFLRLMVLYLVGYTTGSTIAVPLLLALASIQESGFRQGLGWAAGIILGTLGVTLLTIVPDRLVFGVLMSGPGPADRLVLLGSATAAGALALGFRRARRQEERWRDAVERLDLAVSRLAEANLGYQGYAQELRGTSIAEERRRISREIHDSVGYSLTNIRVMLEAAVIRQKDHPDETVRLIEQSMDEAGLCLEQTRQAMRQLRGREVPVPSGPSAIQRLVRAFEEVTGIRVNAEYGNVPVVWPLAVEKAVYRLVQEGMTNAFRHGMATEIIIYLWQDEDALRLSVRDNGRGSGEVKEGIGIAGMRERVEALGGEVAVGPRPDGFEVRAWLPLPDQGGHHGAAHPAG